MIRTRRQITFVTVAVLAIAGPLIWLRIRQPDSAPRGPTNPIPTDDTPTTSGDTELTDANAEPTAVPNTLSLQLGAATLAGPGDGCQIIIRENSGGSTRDVTRECSIAASPAGRVEISASGYLKALEPGDVEIRATLHDAEQTAVITIQDSMLPVSDFALDIVPILTKAGCNSGQCHGAAQGKGGLALSLFGYDPESDHAALTRGLEGRRIDPYDPSASLILLKPTLGMPHGGGLRLKPGSAEETRVRRWIEAGAPWRDDARGRLERLVVTPSEQFMATAAVEQQIQVTAEYEGGIQRDVTRLCIFVTNDPSTLSIDKNGLAHMLRRGQADLVVRFGNKLATVRLAAPYNDSVNFDFASVPRRNFIDDLVVRRLEYMRLPASPRSDDSEFLRRVYFDLIGHMPDPDSRDDSHAVEDFLADTDPEKRDKLIDKLLNHPDFAVFWAIKFGDLLQINSATMGTVTGSYRRWLANSLSLDKAGKSTPYDELVKTLLLAKGSLKGGRAIAPASYYASPREVGEIAEQAARRFLGIRIRCARCHDHPLDVWTQDDYYGFASFFGGVRVEAGTEPLAQEVTVVKENSVIHLRTGQTPEPKYLGGAVAELGDREDARELLVDWLLDPANPRFSRTAANWIWAHLMGRGLVEPVDDMRETNPAVNIELLDELAANFREYGYDLRSMIRAICQSETYQRSSAPIDANASDDQFFSHALLKPLSAYQMADAIALVTHASNNYRQNLGKGTRAIDINDPNVSDYLLDILGRCDRTGGCEVGALVRPASLKLALHLIIGEAINAKLVKQGSLVSDMAAFARDTDPANRDEVWGRQINSIYMRAYCRKPNANELEFWLNALRESSDPNEGLEDMVWAILNSREFVMNH